MFPYSFGKNEKPTPQLPPFFESLKDALRDRILLLLAIFAALSIITGMVYNPARGWIEGSSIYVALLILILITSINDWSKDKKFVRLQSLGRDFDLPVVRGKFGTQLRLNIY